MPKTYELMQAYRDWWRANDDILSANGTLPSAQAVIIAAGWARHVLEIYQAGAFDRPTAEPFK